MVVAIVCLVGALKELEETYVVLAEQTKVLYLIFEVGNTLDTHTQGITAVYLAVDAASIQYVGVDHTTTQNLYPTCVLAEWATFATADITADVHLGTWLGEREV